MRILHTSDWHLGMPLKLGTMIEATHIGCEYGEYDDAEAPGTAG